MAKLSRAARKQIVFQRAQGCCEYCQTAFRNIAQTMHEEHIDPTGGDSLDNLCLSCPRCNLSKGRATSARDPLTGIFVSLYSPRQQDWNEHFSWSDDLTRLDGKTPTARATIRRLDMNNIIVVEARAIWIKARSHPPKLD